MHVCKCSMQLVSEVTNNKLLFLFLPCQLKPLTSCSFRVKPLTNQSEHFLSFDGLVSQKTVDSVITHTSAVPNPAYITELMWLHLSLHHILISYIDRLILA
jgi:hypothetical protein